MNEFRIWLHIITVVLLYMFVTALWTGVGTLERVVDGLELVATAYTEIEAVEKKIEAAETRAMEREARLEAHIRWYIMRRSGKTELSALEEGQ